MDNERVAKELIKLAKGLVGDESSKMNSRVGRSADTQYQYKFRGVEKRLSDVGKLLKKHESDQAKHNTDWGYVGDLGHIDDLLVDIIRFMS